MNRHLPFERGVNFRDLGGYETADGRQVRWRRLFRCGALDRLTEADLAQIEGLQLASVCDFRGAAECAAAPSRLPHGLRDKVRQLEITPGGDFTAEEGILALVSGRRSAAELSATVSRIYREIVTDFAPAYRAMFRHLIEAGGQPVLIHCAGGKDRTGIGAALILTALGVPEDTIVHDYMLSSESVPLRIWLNSLIDHAAAHHPLPAPREDLLAQIMGIWGVSQDWLHAAIKGMDETAGSVVDYLRGPLGVTPSDQQRLRAWYLESP